MREDDINLVSKQQVAQKKVSDSLLKICASIFAVVFLIGMVLLLTSLLLTKHLADLTAQAESLRTQLNNDTKKEKLLIIEDRLSSVRTVLSSRNSVELSASKITSIFPSSFNIDDITADTKQIVVSISSPSLSAYAVLLSDTIPAFVAKHKQSLTSVTIQSFTAVDSGYNLGLSFSLSGPIK